MTLTRRTGALAALALTLVLGACSTPADVSLPGLEAQFGTSDNDFGVDVAYPSSGRVYVLSEQAGNVPDPYWEGNETFSTRTVLNRYDGSGNLTWTRELFSDYCDYECHQVSPRVVLADSKGFVYVLVRDYFTGEDDAYPSYTGYYLYKYDASGYPITSYAIGNAYRDSPSVNQIAVDVAVDSSGNIYAAVAERPTAWGGETLNFVAKYSPTGTLLWQRTSPVGLPYGVTLSSNGNVYVGGSTGVAKYTSSGDLVRKIASGDTRDVAAVGTNTVYARNLTTVRKLDANGRQLWSKAQTGLSGLVIGDMTTDGSANVYITGKYGPSSNRDVFVRKLSASSGTTAYSKVFATSAYDDSRGIATLSGSEVYVTGTTEGSLAHANYGGSDGYLRKMDVNGNRVWTR